MVRTMRFIVAVLFLGIPIGLLALWLQIPWYAIPLFSFVMISVFFRWSPFGGAWWVFATDFVHGVFTHTSIPRTIASNGNVLSHEIAHVVDYEMGQASRGIHYQLAYNKWKRLADDDWDAYFEGDFDYQGIPIKETDDWGERYADVYYYAVANDLEIPQQLTKFYPLPRFYELESNIGTPRWVVLLMFSGIEFAFGSGDEYRPTLLSTKLGKRAKEAYYEGLE